MINFFRKIRKQLADDNKPLKYMRYAFGEILLVVVGILIALSINNWNIAKQERKTEQVNLIALQEEFKNNKVILNKVIDINAGIIGGTKKIILSFEPSILDTISERTMAIISYLAFSKEINYVPNSGVLSELLSSGDLKLIQNQQLKHKLAAFGSLIEQIKYQENEVTLIRRDIQNHYMNTGNYKALLTALGRDFNWKTPLDSVSNKSPYNSIGYLNKLIFFQETSKAATSLFYLPLKEEIEGIINLINSELNNK